MGILLIFLFKRGPIVLRILAWAFILAVVYTAAIMLLTRPSDFQKGPVPRHAQHSRLHSSQLVRR